MNLRMRPRFCPSAIWPSVLVPAVTTAANPHAKLERNICPVCGTVHAVRDISLEVHRGEILGIVGESGSGKSTLMQCLYFDQEPSAGDMRVAAYDGGDGNCFGLSRQQKRLIRDEIFGMVYQNPYLGLRMNFSSLSNIAEKQIAAGIRDVSSMVDRGRELLDRVNIPLRREQDPPRAFSGGMQQRVQDCQGALQPSSAAVLGRGHYRPGPFGSGARARPDLGRSVATWGCRWSW